MTTHSISNLQSPISNPNTQWARIFVDELARCGLTAVCLAPGSRSTPLTLAFAAHPAIRVYVHLDERSAAFFALGMALATDKPAALLCTSGTAAANFHPAIIEAYQSNAPLLALTADRPPELRHSGANQTIDQVKMYGDHVLWAVDVALPEAAAPPVAMRNLRALAARAYARADGLIKGPVHLNFPFRKPLEPAVGEIGDWRPVLSAAEGLEIDNLQSPISNLQSPSTQFSRGIITPTETQIGELAAVINQHERGLIICGPRCPGGDFAQAVASLSRAGGYPILADPLSGVRFGRHVTDTAVSGGYDTFLMGGGPGWDEPEVIIRFGAVPVSKWLNSYLDRINPIHRIHIRENGAWADDSHRTNQFLQAEPATTCRALAGRITPRAGSEWQTAVQATEAAHWQAMDEALNTEFFDGAIVADVAAGMPAGSLLFVGNSLPVRHLDQFGRPLAKPLRVLANRGASGIDGVISTALGAGVTTDNPLVLVIGDISFYHDLNGLLALREAKSEERRARSEERGARQHTIRNPQSAIRNVTIVLLNNNGGGIFRRLPIAQLEPPFTRLFLTPHGLDFEPAARMYGLDFVRANDRDSFRQALADSMADSLPRVIEVCTDGRQDHEKRKTIINQILNKIGDSPHLQSPISVDLDFRHEWHELHEKQDLNS